MGFPLKEGLGLGKHWAGCFAAREADYFGFGLLCFCVSEREPDRVGLTRLMTSWTGMQFQGEYFVYISEPSMHVVLGPARNR